VGLAAWVALLAVVSKLGSESEPRLIAPYYPLLIASVLIMVSLDGPVIRFLSCRILSFLAMAVAMLLVVISPARPLFPTGAATAILGRISPSHAARMERVYSIYGLRYDALKDIRILLPDSEKTVGIIQHNDNLEATLWLPYGSRQIVNVSPDQTPDQLKAQHIHLIVTSDYGLLFQNGMTIDDLTKQWSAVVLAKRKLTLRAGQGPEYWYIVALP
jgi:hypothetical protein